MATNADKYNTFATVYFRLQSEGDDKAKAFAEKTQKFLIGNVLKLQMKHEIFSWKSSFIDRGR